MFLLPFSLTAIHFLYSWHMYLGKTPLEWCKRQEEEEAQFGSVAWKIAPTKGALELLLSTADLTVVSTGLCKTLLSVAVGPIIPKFKISSQFLWFVLWPLFWGLSSNLNKKKIFPIQHKITPKAVHAFLKISGVANSGHTNNLSAHSHPRKLIITRTHEILSTINYSPRSLGTILTPTVTLGFAQHCFQESMSWERQKRSHQTGLQLVSY